jgi:hypothetical protein
MDERGGRDRRRGGGGGRPGRIRRGGGGRPERGDDGARRGRGGRADGVAVGTTGNRPELVETVPIVAESGKERRVALSIGPETATECPLPDLAGGDRLRVFAELELTTDAPNANHPGLIGNAYSYAPEITAWLLLAAEPGEVAAKPQRAIKLVEPWRRSISHEQHHAVVTLEADFDVPGDGLPWPGPGCVNVVVAAHHARAKPGDVLLVGQNEKTPVVVQDMAGIRVVRLRGRGRDADRPLRETACRCAGVPVAKTETVVLSHRLDDLEAGEQLLVCGNLVTDAAPLGYPARISTRLFCADSPEQAEPGGSARQVATWKGQLSKPTGFNCIPADGPHTTRKFGVAAIRRAPGRPLYVNMVAVSAAPFGGAGAGDTLPILTDQSFLEVTRYPADLAG